MRFEWLAAAAAMVCAAPASAAQFVATGTVTEGGAAGANYGASRFSPSLGTLRSVTLTVAFEGHTGGTAFSFAGSAPVTTRFYSSVASGASIRFGSLFAPIAVSPDQSYIDVTGSAFPIFYFSGASGATTTTDLSSFIGPVGSTSTSAGFIVPTYTVFSYRITPAPAPGVSAFYNDYGLGQTLRYTLNYTYDPAATAVPEPASWAMMIVGIGAVGATLRRRRAATKDTACLA